MKIPESHQCFEAALADILDQLYRSFPAPLSFDYQKSFESAKARDLMPDHCKASFTHYSSLYGSTLEFLHREGVVSAGDISAFKAQRIVLTSKGFLILKKPLDSLSTEHVDTLGEKFEKVGKVAGTEILTSITGQAVGQFFAALTKNTLG